MTEPHVQPGRLLFEPRFWPLFVTQFLGAFNDNLFKNALAIGITFKAASLGGLSPKQLVALAGGVFILPFLLFSAISGQLADKYPKASLIRWVKLLEIAVMGLGAIGFLTDHLLLLFITLFLMGLQSTLFGPLKYAALPELLKRDQLVGGNALVEMGTFLAVLLGTIAGGLLAGLDAGSALAISGAVLVVAVCGFASSRKIPEISAGTPELRLEKSLFGPTYRLLRLAAQRRSVWNSILGISWFWLMGALVLSVLPVLVKSHLGGSEAMVTYLLALFSVGVGAGSIVCERLSFEKLELGLVPLGSLGITVFLLDTAWTLGSAFPSPGSASQTAARSLLQLLSTFDGVRLSLDLGLFALTSGVFIVPLYTVLQERSEEAVRARMIAANNVMNALFMVVGALLLTGLYALDLGIPAILALVAILNLAAALYIYTILPEFLFRFLCYCLAHILYRLRVVGRAHIPHTGSAVLVCNHITFIDWLVISSATQRPIRFVMHYEFLKIPLTGRIFRDAKVIPIAGAKEDPIVLNTAFDRISEELRKGELVCIFPEGMLTRDGQIGPFRRGIERILERDPVPVIPMHLAGLWQSRFSRAPRTGLFGRLWSRVTLIVGAPVAPQGTTAEDLQRLVTELPTLVEAAPSTAAPIPTDTVRPAE